jgi:hypothetical protein
MRQNSGLNLEHIGIVRDAAVYRTDTNFWKYGAPTNP